uniref:2-phosphoxylose phosphatase 1 n=1 Tax=Phallusia mammillata TaxID=59560 RepID=A0A6F9D557_9ASCI|nr:lysophosphatidic acid phosphatase type 6-like [Phallusia mammillata]
MAALQSGRKLRTVFVVTRHGQRTPCFVKEFNVLNEALQDDLLTHPCHAIVPIELRSLEGGPAPTSVFDKMHKENGFLYGGTCLSGQLTGKGADAQFRIGKWLRKRYVEDDKLISQEYVEEEIFVRSSNMRRTVLSARSVLAGLYPGHHKQKIPIHVTTFEEEIIQPKTAYSLSFRNQELVESKEAKKLGKEIGEFLQTDTEVDVFCLADNVLSLEELGLKSKVMESPLWNKAYEIAKRFMQSYAVGTNGREREALQSGFGALLDFIVTNIQGVLEEKISHKLFLIGGHDQTVLRTLQSVGLSENDLPPTNSKVIIEVYDKDLETSPTQHVSVKFYRSEENQLPQKEKDFTVEEFIKTVSPYRITLDEYVQRCKRFDRNNQP